MEGKPSKETPGGKKLVILHQHQPVRRKLLSNFSFLKKKSMNLKKMYICSSYKSEMKKLFAESSRGLFCVLNAMGHGLVLFSYLHFVKVGKAAEAHYFQGMQTKKVWSQA